MNLSDFITRLEGAKKNGKGYQARCPAHEDRNPSLSVSESDGKILIKCFAGCDNEKIVAALGLSMSDLFTKPKNARMDRKLGQVVATYDYHNEKGNVEFQMRRYEPKDFRPWHRDGDKWVLGLNGQRRVIYQLLEVLASETVYIVEGEKDADSLNARPFTATCNPFGAGNWSSEYNEYFRGKTVVIIPDNDEPGRKHAQQVAIELNGIAKEIVLLELPGVKDATEFFEAGGTSDDIIGLLERAESWQPSDSRQPPEPLSKLTPLKAARFSEIKSMPIEWFWEPYLAVGTFNIFEGEEELGKTFAALALLCAGASGRGLPMVPESKHLPAANVMIISAEDSLSHVIKPRLEGMNAPMERIIAIEEPFTLNEDGVLRLAFALTEYSPKLVVIDPLFSYTGKINLNNDNEIRSITDKLKQLAERYECVILGIRHINKAKGFGDSRNAGLNGIGWRASARSVLLAGKNPENENQRAICQTKNNLAPKPKKSIGFEIIDGHFYWRGESDLTKETMLSFIRSETTEERGEKHDAMAFLRETLGGGRMLSKDVQKKAREASISEATLRRAKTALNVKSIKDALFDGGWFWALPGVEDAHQDAQICTDEHLRTSH